MVSIGVKLLMSLGSEMAPMTIMEPEREVFDFMYKESVRLPIGLVFGSMAGSTAKLYVLEEQEKQSDPLPLL